MTPLCPDRRQLLLGAAALLVTGPSPMAAPSLESLLGDDMPDLVAVLRGSGSGGGGSAVMVDARLALSPEARCDLTAFVQGADASFIRQVGPQDATILRAIILHARTVAPSIGVHPVDDRANPPGRWIVRTRPWERMV